MVSYSEIVSTNQTRLPQSTGLLIIKIMIIAQISDTHITEDGKGVDQEYQTIAHLQKAVNHINNLPTLPDVVLITGDCVDNGATIEYELFKELLLPLKMPYYLIPGNHDDRLQLRKVFGKQGAQEMDNFV